MSAAAHPHSIVVGYDGSASSRAAVRLAVDRARDGKVFLVYAYDAPGDFWGSEHYQELLERSLSRGERLLARAATDADPRLADVAHETELIAGRPAEVLAGVAVARHAEEIIVGTRGYGTVRAVLGSVAHELLHEATCPVTVIPDGALVRPADVADATDRDQVATR